MSRDGTYVTKWSDLGVPLQNISTEREGDTLPYDLGLFAEDCTQRHFIHRKRSPFPSKGRLLDACFALQGNVRRDKITV